MALFNIEIKAKHPNPDEVRKVLLEQGARFHGTDRQRDTYFLVDKGRLKLRDGNIEKTLIYYQRSDQSGPKQSDVHLYKPSDTAALRNLLTEALGVMTEVIKTREIYYLGNLKFHIDILETVAGMSKGGNYVEIEAAGDSTTDSAEELQKQVDEFIKKFGIREEDLIQGSYSDM